MSRGSRGDAEQADLLRERVAAVQADLPALDRHPAEAQLVQQRGAEDVRVARHQVPRLRRQRAPEARARAFPGARWCRTAAVSSASNVLKRANS